MNWALAFQVAKFVIWIILNVKDLVLEAEKNQPLPGMGSEKFQAVKGAMVIAGKVAGMADDAIDAAFKVYDVDKKIDETVAQEINGQ